MVNISEFSGTIESINMKDTKTGGKYISIKLKEAQTIFGCFEPEICKGLAEGDKVKLVYKQTQSGDRTYYNIQDIQEFEKGEQIIGIPKQEPALEIALQRISEDIFDIRECMGMMNKKLDALIEKFVPTVIKKANEME